MPSERKTTSFDIAYRAGVSQPTVSRALRDSPLVSKKTRERIQKIASELNYKVDKNAANLRLQQSNTLALLIFEDPTSDESLINPFFLAMLGSITRSAARSGYDLLVSFQQVEEDWHNKYEVSHRADGLILLGYGDYISYKAKLDSLEESNARFIIWGPIIEGQPGHSVGSDNLMGGYQATSHLLNLGHRRIAFVGDASEHCPEFLDRYRGHCRALEEAGVAIDEELLIYAENQESSGTRAVEQLVESGQKFTGIVTASDLMAIGVIKGLESKGVHVPNDVAVVGYDGIPAASYMTPALTTVHQNTEESGNLLVQNLIKLIKGEDVESTLITPFLVVRESCTRVRGDPSV